VIIGGGIVGCLSGYLLSRRGFAVTVLEADTLGAHASGFAFGGLDPLTGAGLPEPLLEFSLFCYTRHRYLARELQEATGVDCQFQVRDRLNLAFDKAEATEAQKSLTWMKSVLGFNAQWLEPGDALKLEPQINPACLGALHQQGTGAVESYRLTLAAVRAGERAGMKMLHRRATGLERAGDAAVGVLYEGGRIDAGSVVLAMGPWAREASEWCGVSLPVEPLKGQILRLRTRQQPLNVGLNYRGSYAASKPDGLVWAGTTEEHDGFSETPSASGRDSIMEDLLTMAPGLGDAQLAQHTACLRPVTPDGMPIVDRLPGWDNLYVATGAGRKGILWSTGMAEILADLIAEGNTGVSGAEHLRLSRFGG
jgi:glycine oxidase